MGSFTASLFSLLVSTATAAAPVEGKLKTIRVEGSSTLAPLVTELAKSFVAKNAVRIPVTASGSEEGVECVVRRNCDLGLASKTLTADELATVKAIHLGWDGIAFVAHREAPIEGLTTEQLKSILSGRAKSWKDVGGGDGQIKVFQRDEKRGTRKQLAKELNVKFVGEEAGPNSEVLNRVQRIANSFSYMSLGLALSGNHNLKVLKIDGIAATPDNVASGKYHWRKELVLVIPKENAGEDIQTFVNYILSKKSEALKKFDFMDF